MNHIDNTTAKSVLHNESSIEPDLLLNSGIRTKPSPFHLRAVSELLKFETDMDSNTAAGMYNLFPTSTSPTSKQQSATASAHTFCTTPGCSALRRPPPGRPHRQARQRGRPATGAEPRCFLHSARTRCVFLLSIVQCNLL